MISLAPFLVPLNHSAPTLRTEVVKRQTDLLVELLSFLMDNQTDFFKKIDYLGLVNANVLLSMRDYGYLLNDNEIYIETDKHIAGFIVLKKKGKLDKVELPEMITTARKTENNTKSEQEKGKIKLLLAREGQVDLEYIYLTGQHQQTIESIKRFQSNPFMPASIQNELSKLLAEIGFNLTAMLPQEIGKYIIELVKTKCSPENPVNVNPFAVYNSFQRKVTHHGGTIQNIVKLIREYLMVDKGWI